MNRISDKDGFSEHEGYLHEVFSGIQGEGLYVGERQIFVRFSGCNLHCAYCDTPVSRSRTESCRIEQTAGKRDFLLTTNPLSVDYLVLSIMQLDCPSGLHHSVAFTGGEPLLQPAFLSQVARQLKEQGLKVFLETNGSLPESLQQVLPLVDVISMDVKLSGSTGMGELLEMHESCLSLAVWTNVYVKCVVTAQTEAREVLEAAEMLRRVDPSIPLILQPATRVGDVHPPSASQVLEWQAECKKELSTVRLIPQCHKIMGQL